MVRAICLGSPTKPELAAGVVVIIFGNSDLSFTSSRSHDLSGYNLLIDNSSSNNPDVDIWPTGTIGLSMNGTNQSLGDVFCTAGGIYMQTNQTSGLVLLGGLATELRPAVCGGNNELRFVSNTEKYIGFSPLSGLTTDVSFILPTGDGSSGQSLSTDGNGNMSWVDSTNLFNTDLVLSSNRNHNANDNNFYITGLDTLSFQNTEFNNISMTDASVSLGGGSTSFAVATSATGISMTALHTTLASVSTSGSAHELRFREVSGGVNYVGLAAPFGIDSNTIWILPSGDGTSGQILSTDGAGNLSWVTDNTGAGGGGGSNFANTNLTFDGNREHDANSNDLDITNIKDLNIAGTGAASIQMVGGNDVLLSYGVSSSLEVVDGDVIIDSDSLTLTTQTNLRMVESAGGSSEYISIEAPSSIASNFSLILPSDNGSSGQHLVVDDSGNLSWSHSLETPTGSSITVDDTIQIVGITEQQWTDSSAEATIDLTGLSTSQKTTLTSDQVLSFAGSAPSGYNRTYYLEVSTTGDTLSITGTHDPGSGFTQPSYSPYVIAIKTLSDGTPRYAGVI